MAPSAPAPAPIGAVVRALAALKVESPNTRATVLAAMGWADGTPVAPALPPVLVSQPTPRREPPLPEGPPEPPAEDRQPLPSTLTTLTTAAPTVPKWLEESEPLPLPDPRRAVPLYAKPIEPLFSPQITRAILSRLASAPAAVGEVDVARLVEIVATGRPFTRLPRRTVPTLAKGLELLIDDGRGLDPFSNDVSALIDDLWLAVGRDRLTIRLFRGFPGDGVIDPATAAVTPYVPPPPGTPVLAVTDLGTAEYHARSIPIAVEAWLAFAAELRSQGNPLAVLMPGSSARLPAVMRRALAPIRWDRGTGARLNDRSPVEPDGEREGVERLARLASIAGRIDPQLLRALRLHLAPELGVEAEADLWFGRLAQSAAVTGVVLRPEQQRRLQDELAGSDPDLLDRAWEILYRLRTDRPWSEREKVRECSWLVALEELTFQALRGVRHAGPEREAAKRRLTQILKLLISEAGSERAVDAVAWTRSAKTRLPAAVMELKPMRHLAFAAALRGADTLASAEMVEAVRDEEAAYLTPRVHHATVPVWLRLVEGGLEASLVPLPDAHRIEAPTLEPLVLAVDWRADGKTNRGALELHPPRRAFVAMAAETAEVTVPGGDRVRLSRARGPVLINVPPSPAVFIDREQDLKAALAACLREAAAVTLDTSDRPLRLFISYAHADERYRSELATVLQPPEAEGSIEVQKVREIRAGDEWAESLSAEMAQADAFLVLVSPDYLASEWARQEMELALSRRAEGAVLMIPIIVRDCDWQQTPLAELQVLPKDGRAMMDRSDAAARTMLWMEIGGALERAFRAHRRALRSRREAALKPRMVGLVGPEGIGRFTLARKLAHDPAIHAHYPDGILWLGEDGQGYPRQWLRDYCQAIGEPAPFNKKDGVERDAFGALFADRRVLFVADQRTASDMLPTLEESAGPGCTVLVLAAGAPSKPDERTVPIPLAPLAAEAAGEAAVAFAMPTDAPADLIAFAEGNPLLLRLAAAGADRVEPRFLLEHAARRLAEGNPKRPAEERMAVALLAGLWSVDLKMPDAKQRGAPDVGGLDARQRRALRRLIVTHGYASRFERGSVDGVAVDSDGVIRLGLVEDLGAEVRLHPLLRRAISEIDPDTAEIAAMLRELERPETSHQRRQVIGERLDARGDPRRGVGVGADGTPELDWCPVPGGEVTIDDVKRTQKRVQPFHIGRFPVTVAQYRAFLDADDGWRDAGWWAKDLRWDEEGARADIGDLGNHPAVRVSWFDAVAFCRWLSLRLGFPVRLPDEWEWQQAATGGDAERTWPWGDDWKPDREAYRANTLESRLVVWVTAVGMYPAGAAPGGALDMAGTVWEWCANQFDDPASTKSRPDEMDSRVLRGGSWDDNQVNARAAFRNRSNPDFRYSNIGFRVVSSSPSSRTDH